ncbi:hypothetical protein EON80_20765 [bacterium]|nr:MAG: hypothetical protein EON80_20765 [bacterium]
MVTSLKSRDLIRNEQDRFLEEPLLLSIGSKFKASDRHWGATYTLVAIQADGIILNYEAEGERPASIRNSAGQLHVSWK